MPSFAKSYLDQYIENAKRTESTKGHVIFDPEAIAYAIGMFIGAGNILDQIKKYVFYNKVIDFDKIKSDLDHINGFSESFLDMEREDGTFAFNMDECPVNDRLFHSVIGIATEATELVEAMKNGFPDNVNLLEEFGDLNWYEAIGIDAAGGSFDEVLERNIEKLRHRYPGKFSDEKAINRDVRGERQILSTLEKE